MISLLAFLGLVTLIYSNFLFIKECIYTPPLVPKVDLTTCAPIGRNPKRLWAVWTQGAAEMSSTNRWFAREPSFPGNRRRKWPRGDDTYSILAAAFRDRPSAAKATINGT